MPLKPSKRSSRHYRITNGTVLGSDRGRQRVDRRHAGCSRAFHGRLPGLRLIDALARRGAAHARNAAVKEASGEGLAFCDADHEG